MLRFTPWMAAKSRQQPLDDPSSYLYLDYTQMIMTTVLYQSLRRKHFLVFLVCLVSIILKVQMVLSTGLFESVSVQIARPVPVRTLDSFESKEVVKGIPSELSYFWARAAEEYNMNPFFGVAKNCAYQTYQLSAEDGTVSEGTGNQSRGTRETPLKAVVDGIFTEMTCLKAEDCSLDPVPFPTLDNMYEMKYSFKFENCNETLQVSDSPVYVDAKDGETYAATRIRDLGSSWNTTRPCSSLPQQNPQFLYYSVSFSEKAETENVPKLDSYAAVLCTPRTWISKVEVVDDGFYPNVTELREGSDDSEATEVHITNVNSNIWDLLVLAIPDNLGGWGRLQKDGRLHIGEPLRADRYLTGLETDLLKPLDDVIDSEALAKSVKHLTEALGPMIAHFELRTNNTGQISGFSIESVDRLQMNLKAGVPIIVLSACGALAAFWILYQSWKGSFKVWYRNPTTMLGLMLFMQSKDNKLNSDTNLAKRSAYPWTHGSELGNNAFKARWYDRDSRGPLILSLWFRVMFGTYVAGLIASLIATLRISQTSDGLANVDNEAGQTYTLLWKFIPALAMLMVALHASSSDARIRGLATFSMLFSRTCDAKELDMSLLDVIGPRALYHSLQLKIPAVSVSQALATMCVFLTTLSSILFEPAIMPAETTTSFSQKTWFGAVTSNSDAISTYQFRRELVSTFALPSAESANMTYPRNTYADLLFPELGIEIGGSLQRTSSLRVNTPAAQMSQKCERLEQDVDFMVQLSRGGDVEPATATLENFPEYPGGRNITYTFEFEKRPNLDGDVNMRSNYFAFVPTYNETADDKFPRKPDSWRAQSYAWGSYLEESLELNHLSAWWCNFSWVEVETQTTLVYIDGDFNIDRNSPPTVNTTGSRPWSPPFSVPELPRLSNSFFPENLGSDPRFAHLDDQFQSLMEPVGPVGFEDLNDPQSDEYVLSLVNEGTRVALAQIANYESRLPLTSLSVQEPYKTGSLQDVSAEIIDNRRYRLVQSYKVTWSLVAILLAVFAVNAWAIASSAILRREGRQGLSMLSSATSARRMGRWSWRRWVLDLELRGVAPSDYNSIALMAALLDGSNYAEHMPENAEFLPKEELYERLGRGRCQLQWSDDEK